MVQTLYHVATIAADGTRDVFQTGFTSLSVAICWAFVHQRAEFGTLVAEPAHRALRPQGLTRAERAGLT